MRCNNCGSQLPHLIEHPNYCFVCHTANRVVQRYKIRPMISTQRMTFNEAQALLRRYASAVVHYDTKVAYINMDTPNPASGGYGVQSWSKGVPSFGLRVESPDRVEYVMAEPVWTRLVDVEVV